MRGQGECARVARADRGASNVAVDKRTYTMADPRSDDPKRRPGQTQPIGKIFARIAAPALKKRGLTNAELLMAWPQVVGSYFALHTAPLRLTFPRGRGEAGVLHLSASAGLVTAIQHDAPRLIERINGYFGHKAVGRLKLSATRQVRPVKRRRLPSEPGPTRPPPAAISALEDSPMKEALIRLHRQVVSGE